MCGIVGAFSVDGAPALSESDLVAMRDRMARRGPDDAGVWVRRGNGYAAALGHRRLSIIDLSPLGRQPMSTADERLWIVFNGEIFNYRELRTALLATGRYSFRSLTDTEVILYGIEEWGLDGCLKRLRGMYAFGVVDTVNGSITLVRDPLGVKPLYYLRRPGALAFASEIKALLAMPGVQRRVNDAALSHYLTFAAVPAPQTLFDGIAKLEAGTYVTFDRRGGWRQVRYWDPSAFIPSDRVFDERECVEEVRRLLRRSVARRMISDVPVGAFLSGGLDSSLMVALMAEGRSRPVRTYSIGIKGDPANELDRARATARRFGTDHCEVLVGNEEFVSLLPRIAIAQDEPLADPVCVPLYVLSRVARESGTPVIQVGEGSDELFAGYPIYQRFEYWDTHLYRRYLGLPAWLRAAASRMVHGRLSPVAEDALRRAAAGDPLFIGNAVAFWDSEKSRLLRGGACADASSSQRIRELVGEALGSDALRRITGVELVHRLPELLLMRVDKMSMAHSIETRVPFLDEDLVEFALTIPSDLKRKPGQSKYVLKRAAEGLIPQEIIDRRKWGFCGSATNMLTERLTAYARETIFDSPLIAERCDAAYIESIFRQHRSQKRFNSFKIWNLLNLALWYDAWFVQDTAAPPMADSTETCFHQLVRTYTGPSPVAAVARRTAACLPQT
jgi:asparagine synthase (glutamine-hydrolysing)